MKTKQRNRLVLGIAIAMIAFLLIYFNVQKVSDFIRSVVIEAQLKKQYDVIKNFTRQIKPLARGFSL